MISHSSYIITLAFCAALSSCGFLPDIKSTASNGVPNENYAAHYPDFSVEVSDKLNKRVSTVMRYKVGDLFRLRKPMFLCYSVEHLVQLRDTTGYPEINLKEYKMNPDAYRFGGENPYQVIKIVPAGTVIGIVKIAEIGYSPNPYFVIQGKTDWFRSSAFKRLRNLEYSEERIVLEKGYNKELFEKLSRSEVNPTTQR